MNNIYPVKLSPAYKDYLWGGEKLKKFFNKDTDASPLAESWEKHTRYSPPLARYRTNDFGISSDAKSTTRALSAAERYFFCDRRNRGGVRVEDPDDLPNANVLIVSYV